MSESPGIVVWAAVDEFNKFAEETLPSMDSSVTVDKEGIAFKGKMANFLYKDKNFFLVRHDDDISSYLGVLNIFAVVIMINSNDTKDIVQGRINSMKEMFENILIVIYSKEIIKINLGKLDENTKKFLCSKRKRQTKRTKEKEVSGEWVIRLLSLFNCFSDV
jgi:hypothetical protein